MTPRGKGLYSNNEAKFDIGLMLLNIVDFMDNSNENAKYVASLNVV